MYNLLTNRKFVTFISFVLAILTIVSLVILNRKQAAALPKIVNSDPSFGTTNGDIFKPISLDFNLPVISSDFSITSAPPENWTISQSGSASILLTHQQILHPATLYTLNLTWQNKPLPPLTFTTQLAQGDPRLVQELTEELTRDYPLARFTPYETSNYKVVYSAPMTFEITIKNPNLKSDEVVTEIKAWVTQNGGDVSAHKFIVAP